MQKKLLLALSFLVLNCSLVDAQNTTVAPARGLVGQKAKPLIIQEWIKGDPVNSFEPGMIYVIDFSFIECTPCIKSIPHLTKMARKYRGKVKVVHVFSDVNCRDSVVSEAYLTRLKKLVHNMDTTMDYTVGADKGVESTYRSWGKSQYPSAQVVDGKGMVVWCGGATQLDPVLAALVAGKKVETVETQEKKSSAIHMYMNELEKKGQIDELLSVLDSMIMARPDEASYCFEKFRLLTEHKQYSKASDLLKWILNNKDRYRGKTYPSEFAKAAYTKFDQPDYELALAAMNWEIEDAELETSAASGYFMKADIYLHRAKTGNKDLLKKEDVDNAIRQYHHAFMILEKPTRFKRGQVL